MPSTIPISMLEKFSTFGDLLRFLRRRAGITQLELSIAVGYSISQISRLEQNLRQPDLPTIEARFIPALLLEDEPNAVARFLELAASVRRQDAPALGLCPYKGLDYFDEADVELFVGRESLTEKLAGRVLTLASPVYGNKCRFFTIVGASGSGKTSLVRAGLVPALRWNNISANWPIYFLTPSTHPLESLATSLLNEGGPIVATTGLMNDLQSDPRALSIYIKRQLKASTASYLLLVIDQFEELFSVCRSEDERSAFIGNLMIAASTEARGAIVVITLRSDFYTHCASYGQLREAIATHQEYIGAMSDAEMRRAIEEPAQRGHWEFEPGLIDLILHDVGHEPGALPLLSHALFETWQRRQARTLTLSGYTSTGGVRGAIAETAETIFTEQFTPEQQAIARRIFIRLTELGDQTSTGDTRRSATFNELILRPEESDTTRAVVKALADARLITTNEDTVQVAHEALIREWPTLRGWLEDNREDLRLHRQLTDASQEWLESQSEPDILFRGARLAQAREWAEAHGEDMNALEREFLQSSIATSEREAAEREAQHQRELSAAQKLADTERQRKEEGVKSAQRLKRRSILVSLVGGLAIILTFFAIYTWQRTVALDAVDQILYLAKAAQQANQAGRGDLALALAREAVKPDNLRVEAVMALRSVALGPGKRAMLTGHTGSVSATAFSPDGTTLFSGSCAKFDSQNLCTAGELILWDINSRIALHRWQAHSGWITAVAFSLNGQMLISGAEDGSLMVWDLNGEPLRQLKKHTDRITGLAIAFNTGCLVSASADGSMYMWELRTGEAIFEFDRSSSPILSLALAANRLNAVTLHQDGSILLWSLTSSQPVKRLEGYGPGVGSVLISPDARWILITYNSMPVMYLMKVEIQSENLQSLQTFKCISGQVAISPDASNALIACQTVIYQLDFETWEVEQIFSESSQDISVIAINKDGHMGVSGSEDGILSIWNLGSGYDYKNESINAGFFTTAASSLDAKYLLVNDGIKDENEQPALLYLANRSVYRTFSNNGSIITSNAVAISPDNHYVAVTGSWTPQSSPNSTQPVVLVWQSNVLNTYECSFSGFLAPGQTLAFSPDNHYLLVGSRDLQTKSGQLFLLEARTCNLVRQFANTEDVSSIAFSSDGNLAITGSVFSDRAILWDVATGNEIKRYTNPGSGPIPNVIFGPNDSMVLGSGAGALYLWDVHTGVVIRSYSGISMFPVCFAISPDGKYILVGTLNGDLILLDFATGEEIDSINPQLGIISTFFSPDSSVANAITSNTRVIEWPIAEKNLSELIDWINSNRYVRELTCPEKIQYHVADPQCKP